MDREWNFHKVLEVLGVAQPSNLPKIPLSNVELIPSKCIKGSLFIAAPFTLRALGFKDQNAAIKESIYNGASAAVTNLSSLSFQSSIPVLRVKNTD